MGLARFAVGPAPNLHAPTRDSAASERNHPQRRPPIAPAERSSGKELSPFSMALWGRGLEVWAKRVDTVWR